MRPLPFIRQGLGLGVCGALCLSSSFGSVPPDMPFIFSGLPVENPDFSILVNEYGYSDSMLDYRAPFMGREFLSGEWAGAVRYEGGTLGSMTRWLPNRFVFPDYYTPMPHFTPIKPSYIGLGDNVYGFPASQSRIENADLEIAIKSETIDFGASLTGRLRLGTEANSLGGSGDSLPSTRYGFKQTYEFKNISGQILNNMRFFQFIHTLHGDWGVYDSRDHGGGMSSYRYGVTLQGESFGLNRHTMETVKHTDTVSMKFSHVPSGYELGTFGMKLGGDHQTGEPAVGVHKSISSNSLSMVDFVDPDETIEAEDAWVSGAVSFDLGSLAPDATVSIDMILGMHTSFDLEYGPLNLVIHKPEISGDMLHIDFRETTGNPMLGYSLRHSATGEMSPDQWDQAAASLTFNSKTSLFRFSTALDTMAKPELLFLIRPSIINED